MAQPAYPLKSEKRALWLLVLALLLVGVLWFWRLLGDAPSWMEYGYILDEGWWADSARGKLLFNDYFADDLGYGIVVAPAHTWAIMAFYKLAGIGLLQTRLFSVLSGLMILGIVAWVTNRQAGPRPAIWAVLLLGISPLFLGYSRLGYYEPFQLLLIMICFAAGLQLRSKFAAFIAGLSISLSWGEPTSVTSGLIPLFCACLAQDIYHARARKAEFAKLKKFIRLRYVFILWGILAGAAVLTAFVVLPDAQRYWRTLRTEGGVFRGDWSDYLTGLAYAFVSMKSGDPVHWKPAIWSPLILTAFWLYAMQLLAPRSQKNDSQPDPSRSFEIYCLAWAASALLILVVRSTNWYLPRYYYPLLPPFAILGAIALQRLFSRRQEGADIIKNERRGYLWTTLALAVLTLPLLIILKPWAVRGIEYLGRNVPLGEDKGLGTTIAGLLVMALWFLAIAGVAIFRSGWRVADQISWRAGKLVCGLFLLFECGLVGSYFASMKYTFLQQQNEVAKYIREGDVVLGDAASTVFQPYQVRTVRRSKPYRTSVPSLNADVWERLQPQYVLEMKRINFQPYAGNYKDIIGKGYDLVHTFSVGPYANGQPRYEFELYQSQAGQNARKAESPPAGR